MLKENYFIASYDNRFASNKKSKNSEYVGNSYETKVFSTLDKFLETSNLLQYNTCSFGSYFTMDQIWANIEDNKAKAIRNLKINTQGFQLVFIDVDTESFNDVYSPTYIDNNLEKIKDTNCALVLKSTSYGSVVEGDKYPNGIKEGKRLLWILDKPIEASSIINYFSAEEWNNITSNVCGAPTYNLIRDGKVDEAATQWYNEITTVISLVYKYFVCYLGHKVGISELNPETVGFDPASLKIAQKMMGSGKGTLLKQDVRVNHREILKEAILWIKDRYNYTKKKTESIRISHTDGTYTEFDPIEFNADIASILTAYIPPRTKGSNTYQNYLVITTALKQLGVDKEHILKLFDDRTEGENVYNRVKPIFDSADQALSVLESTLINKMGIKLLPKKEHNKNAYKKIVKVNERYLSSSILEAQISSGNNFINFQSLHGTGKTMMLKNALPFFEYKKLKVIYVCHLRSILRTTAQKLKLQYYEDGVEFTNGICITPDSFHRLDDMDFSDCVLVIDEHTQVIRTIANSYMDNKDKNYYKSLQNLWKCMETCNVMITMDADDYIGVPELMREKPLKIENTYETDKMKLKFFRWAQDEHYEDRVKATKKEYCSRTTHAFETILTLLKQGKKIAIPCSKKETAKKLHNFLIKNNMNGFCLMSETENKAETFDNIAFNKVTYQYVIYTYTAWTGFDVSSDMHKIDLVVAIFEGVAGLNHDDMAQSMRRFRGVSEGIVYGQWTASIKLLPFEVFMDARKKKEKKLMQSSLVQSFDDVQILKVPTKFHDMLLYVDYLNKTYANYTSFNKFCEKIGTGPIYYESNEWRPEENTKKMMAKIANENRTNSIKELVEAEYLTDSEYTRLWKSDKTHKEHVALEKTYLAKAIGKETLDHLLKNADLFELSQRELKSLPKILSNYMMGDTDYQLALLKYKSKYLPEWDKEADKLAVNLLMGDTKSLDFDKQMEVATFVHGLCKEHLDMEITDETISSMFKNCVEWRKNNKSSYASISYGDTMVNEQYMGINVNAIDHESIGDAKFYRKWKATANHLINGIIGQCGYSITKTRSMRNGVRSHKNFISLNPMITEMKNTGAIDYINNKIKPTIEGIEISF